MKEKTAIHPSRSAEADILAAFRTPESQKQAFAKLVQLYQKPIYWHIRKMVVVHEDADDLVQEVFVKVWRKLDTFRDDSRLYTWLYRIATNESLNFLKKKRSRLFLPINDYSSKLGAHIQNDALFDGEAIDRQLQLALLQLPDKQRLVFNMKYFDDMPYQQISEILGTSVGALKASYHLATQKVKTFLDGKESWENLPGFP